MDARSEVSTSPTLANGHSDNVLEERDLTGVVMSLDAFMLSRFTTLTPLNGEMLVETKLILFNQKQNT